MASKDSAIIDLDDSDLQFTETKGTTHTFSNVPDSAVDDDFDGGDDRDRLLPGADEATAKTTANFFSIKFYQQFFDVDTVDVKNRMLAAMVPLPRRSFLTDVLKSKPDLYGPIWICATLVISVAVTGNLASYFQSALSGEDSTKGFVWHYDFHKVTLAATAVFSYAWLVPAGIYAFLWWTSAQGALAAVSFMDLLCLYGYSLVIYIPVSILWLIQYNWVQWTLVLLGAGLSGGVIVFTLYPVFKDNIKNKSIILIAVIVALHLLLACGFMLYFFHVPSGAASGAATPIDTKPEIKNTTVKAEEGQKKEQEEKAKKEEETVKKEEKRTAEKVEEQDKGTLVETKEDDKVEKPEDKAEKSIPNENDAKVEPDTKDQEADTSKDRSEDKQDISKSINEVENKANDIQDSKNAENSIKKNDV